MQAGQFALHKKIHLKLSALPLATGPLVIARPPHSSALGVPATQRPRSPPPASGGREKLVTVTACALPRKVENRKKMQTPPSSCRNAVLPLWIGRYVLLYCCWSVGGWWVVGARCGGGSLALQDRFPRWRGFAKENELSPISYHVLKTREPTKRSSRTSIYCRACSCAAVLL